MKSDDTPRDPQPAPFTDDELVEVQRLFDGNPTGMFGGLYVGRLLAALDATRDDAALSLAAAASAARLANDATRPSGDGLPQDYSCGWCGNVFTTHNCPDALVANPGLDATRPSGDEWTVDAVFDALGRGDITEPAARDGIKTLLSVARPSGDEALRAALATEYRRHGQSAQQFKCICHDWRPDEAWADHIARYQATALRDSRS